MDDPQPTAKPPRLRQISLRGMLLITAACALMFGAFRALGLEPRASLLICGLLAASLLAAWALLWVLTDAEGSDS